MTEQPEFTSQASLKSGPLSVWIGACLADEVQLPGGAFPLDLAELEGLLPWLAYQLHEERALPPALQEDLRHALRRWSLMHLDCESELERLIVSANQSGIRFLAFKGHSVSRTLYPNPACRPTSDFDLLIDPSQVDAVQSWLVSIGYSSLQNFVGTTWLGAQSWSSSEEGNARFHVDLHWDYSNRMYFRKRLSFDEIWAASRTLPCGAAGLRVPCPVDDLIFACVHLAAFDPGMHVRLIWLLDIYLLMASLDESDMGLLLARAKEAHALEACLVFGERAAALGDADVLAPVLAGLRGVVSWRRWRGYQRTLRWRGWDLGCYWGRLGGREKGVFFGDMGRWVLGR